MAGTICPIHNGILESDLELNGFGFTQDGTPITFSSAWGSISGTLSNQTDLQTALNAKSAVGHTHAFSSLTSIPTTIAGYGITDAYTKTETDSAISSAAVGLLDDRGSYNASGNVFPSSGGSGSAGAVLKGDLWTISVAGTLGGVAVTAGDVVRALVDAPGQTASNWVVTENNLGFVPVNTAGTLALGGFSSITGVLPVANGGTGLSALGTGVAAWWANPTSANLASLLTDETGTGALVFGTNPTLTGATVDSGSFVLSGNQNAAAWTTNGIRIKGTTGTLTDTSSSGTVAAAVTNVLGGNTIAASSATTYTKYSSMYLRDPVAGTNVTFTNKYSLETEGAALFGGRVVAGNTPPGSTNANEKFTVTGTTYGLFSLNATTSGGDVGFAFGQGNAGGSSANGFTVFGIVGTQTDANYGLSTTASGLSSGDIVWQTYYGGAFRNIASVPVGTNNLSLGGNLTVSGGTITGGTTGLTLNAGGTNQNITLTPSGTGNLVATLGAGAVLLNADVYSYGSTKANSRTYMGDAFRAISTRTYGWVAGNDPTQSTDTALGRNAAGVVEINNGSAGTFRDLKLRTMQPGGGMTQTVSTPMVDGSQTWNDGAVTFTGVKYNVTDTASATGSLLLDLQAGGVSKFNVRKDGLVTPTGFLISGSGTYGGDAMWISPNGVAVTSTSYLVFGTDTYLRRDGAANTLAQRNGTNAQMFRVYNTYTDASNYERISMGFNSNIAYFSTFSAGTGTARAMYIGTSGNSALSLITNDIQRWTVSTAGHFIAVTDNTYDFGASGATRPRHVYAAGSINAGSNLNFSNTGYIQTTSRAVMSSPADGVWLMQNAAVNNFDRIQLGGTTSSFPAIKRNGAGIDFRLADDSAYTTIAVGAVNYGGTTNSFAQISRDAVNGFTLQSAAGTATWNDASTATSGTVTTRYLLGFAAPTLSATNTGVTYTNAATLYIAGAPAAGTNVTIGSPLALAVAAGNVYFGGNLTVAGAIGGNIATLYSGATSVPLVLSTNTGVNNQVRYDINSAPKWYAGVGSSDDRFRWLNSDANSTVERFSIFQDGRIRLSVISTPASPVDGDVWIESGHMYARIGGATKQLDN